MKIPQEEIYGVELKDDNMVIIHLANNENIVLKAVPQNFGFKARFQMIKNADKNIIK